MERKMKNLQGLYFKLKSSNLIYAVFILACLLIVIYVFNLEGSAIEKIGISVAVASVLVALIGFMDKIFLRNASNAESKAEERESELLDICSLIKNSFVDTRFSDDEGSVAFRRIDENGIKVLNEENKCYIYIEVNFTYSGSTKDCELHVIVRNLKGDDWRDYEEPYKIIHYKSTATSHVAKILNVRNSDEYVEETEGYHKFEPLGVGAIGDNEWNEIISVLSNILTAYAMERE